MKKKILDQRLFSFNNDAIIVTNGLQVRMDCKYTCICLTCAILILVSGQMTKYTYFRHLTYSPNDQLFENN